MKKSVKKEEYKICLKCKQKIHPNERYTLLGTYNLDHGKKEEVFFHFECFVDYWNERVLAKAKGMVGAMQGQALQIMRHPMIAGVLKQVGGTEMLQSMLSTPLNPEKISKLKEEINDRSKKDGRGKSKKRR